MESRVAILGGGAIDTTTHFKDTALGLAKAFIALYDGLKDRQQKLEAYRDSLQQEYLAQEKRMGALKKLLQSNLSTEEKQKAIQPLLEKEGVENVKLRKLLGIYSSIKTLAVGKVLPSYSDLTLKNVNVTGVNFEYYRSFYFAFSAGVIDYRARDFVYNRAKRKPQMVYLTRFGYGSTSGSHAYLTGFKGKKQLLSTSHNAASLDIYGLSFESQLVLLKYHKIIAELAQSASPPLVGMNNVNEKPSFQLNDEKNKAWSIRWISTIPKTRSRLEGYYKYRGINFQSFSSYYANAAMHSWQIKADQFFWKRQLRINLAISKNNYENSELPVRYSGSTAFKSVSLYFKRKKWPSLQAGYMPSSQLSVINGQVFENFYHILNGSINHSYKLGLARAFSIFSYNRFYNDSKDSGFVYYNAKNIYFSQLFQFESYGATLNISRSDSRDYLLTILDAGITAQLKKQHALGLGVKINQLNNESLRVGIYGQGKWSLKNIGEVNLWIEKTYLPGWGGTLTKNQLYTLGFTRFFK